MSTDTINGHASAIIALGRAEGSLDALEDELLAVARAVDGNDELREKLDDERLPVGRRLTFIESDVLGMAQPSTRAALAMLITVGRVGDLSAIADEVARTVAASRDEELAEVVVAVELDDGRKTALKTALERVIGRSLDLKFTVDPEVVGGVRARVGDTVIDGSVMRRLTELRTRVGA